MPCPSMPENPTQSLKCNKGDIHWFSPEGLDDSIATDKIRPYIIISRNNPNSNRVIVAPISDIDNYLENGKLKYPYHAALLKRHYKFLDKDSAVLLDQVYTIPKGELWQQWYLGTIYDMEDIDKAITYNFDTFQSIANVFGDFLKQYEQIRNGEFSRK